MSDMVNFNKKNSNSNWYIINVYPGFENKVADSFKNFKLKNVIFDVILVEQSEQKKNKKKVLTKKSNLYPGYIFVNMIMSDEVISIIKSTPVVIGYFFKKKPTPVSFDEMESVLKRIGRVDKNMYFNYNIGDLVKIINGPFSGIKGKIISFNKESGLCKIETIFFGRHVPTEVEFINIEKI